jgi:hypothetical protein
VLNYDTNIIVGGSTIVLVLVTALNLLKIDEIFQKQRSLAIEPFIVVYVKEYSNNVTIIDLIIENVGQGVAKNVKITTNRPEFLTISGDSINQLPFFKYPIQVLGPKKESVIHFVNLAQMVEERRKPDNSFDIEELKRELSLKIYIKYENIDGATKSDEFNINLCTFWGLRYPIKPL